MLFNNNSIVMTGESLKELLLSLKISQTDIAKKLGLSQQSFNQMLSASDVKSSLLERVANAIGVSISKLYEGCCPTSPDDPSLYGKSPSAPIDGVSTDLQRTHNGGTTEAERIKFLEEQVAFYKEQTAYYKEMAERKDKQ
jgi:transcriptional regulator with XRE-family HTH domain